MRNYDSNSNFRVKDPYYDSENELRKLERMSANAAAEQKVRDRESKKRLTAFRNGRRLDDAIDHNLKKDSFALIVGYVFGIAVGTALSLNYKLKLVFGTVALFVAGLMLFTGRTHYDGLKLSLIKAAAITAIVALIEVIVCAMIAA